METSTILFLDNPVNSLRRFWDFVKGLSNCGAIRFSCISSSNSNLLVYFVDLLLHSLRILHLLLQKSLSLIGFTSLWGLLLSLNRRALPCIQLCLAWLLWGLNLGTQLLRWCRCRRLGICLHNYRCFRTCLLWTCDLGCLRTSLLWSCNLGCLRTCLLWTSSLGTCLHGSLGTCQLWRFSSRSAILWVLIFLYCWCHNFLCLIITSSHDLACLCLRLG